MPRSLHGFQARSPFRHLHLYCLHISFSGLTRSLVSECTQYLCVCADLLQAEERIPMPGSSSCLTTTQ